MARKLSLHPKKKEWDQTFQMMSWWKADEVRAAQVMVVGAGALGNEVLKNLALMNVGRILIVDFDRIEYHNLSRSVLFRESDCEANRLKADVAAERIREINPNVKVQTIQGDIMLDVGLGVFRRMQAVIGCLDNRLARMYINRHCYKVGRTWIDGGIENLAGQISVYTPDVSCYECTLSQGDWVNINAKLGCPDVARRNSSQGRVPTTPISSSIIAAMQVQEALKVIHGNHEQSLAGQRFYYEGMSNFIMQFKLAPLQEDCLAHFPYDPIIEASTLSADRSVGETLAWLNAYFEVEDAAIELDHEVVLEVATRKTEQVYEMVVAKPHLTDKRLRELAVDPGETVVFTKEVNVLDASFPAPDRKLRELGIPPLHILRVRAGDDIHFVELTGDEAFLNYT